MNSSPIPNDFHFEYTPGLCLSCGQEAVSGLYCANCLDSILNTKPGVGLTDQLATLNSLQNWQPEENPQLRSIREMKSDETGYISLHAIFEYDDKYWVINSFLVSPYPTGELTVKIYSDDGEYLAESDTLDFDAIPLGWPDNMDGKWASPLYYTDDDIDVPPFQLPPHRDLP